MDVWDVWMCCAQTEMHHTSSIITNMIHHKLSSIINHHNQLSYIWLAIFELVSWFSDMVGYINSCFDCLTHV